MPVISARLFSVMQSRSLIVSFNLAKAIAVSGF